MSRAFRPHPASAVEDRHRKVVADENIRAKIPRTWDETQLQPADAPKLTPSCQVLRLRTENFRGL